MISVAMCTYNGTRFLKEQLDSILSQTLPPDEIVICDDCSTDGTAELAKTLLTKWSGKWQVVENETNLGFRRNFEKAIQLCHGDLIFLSDQDDVWLPKKIEIMTQVLKAHPNIMLAFHDAELVNEKLEKISTSFWEILDFVPQYFFLGDYSQLIARNVVQGTACAFRRILVSHACPFPMNVMHDEWLAMVALSLGDLFPVSEVLIKYRQWGKNAVGGVIPTKRARFQKWLFNLRHAAEIHRKAVVNKYYINKEWENRYKKQIRPSLLEEYGLAQKRFKYINSRSLKILTMRSTYWAMYPTQFRCAKEFVKDVLSVII